MHVRFKIPIIHSCSCIFFPIFDQGSFNGSRYMTWVSLMIAITKLNPCGGFTVCDEGLSGSYTASLAPQDQRRQQWTHWDFNPGPSACEADVIPLHHEPARQFQSGTLMQGIIPPTAALPACPALLHRLAALPACPALPPCLAAMRCCPASLSRFALRGLALPCHVLPCLAPCLGLHCRALHGLALPCHAWRCLVPPCPALPSLFTPCLALPGFALLCPAVSCLALPFHVMPRLPRLALPCSSLPCAHENTILIVSIHARIAPRHHPNAPQLCSVNLACADRMCAILRSADT